LPGGTVGFAAFKNLDATNTISLRNGTGGANFTDIPPGSTTKADATRFQFDASPSFCPSRNSFPTAALFWPATGSP